MSKKLSKISRDLNIGISVITDFLNKNGHQCEEDPNETLNADIIDFVYSNIKGFLSASKGKELLVDQTSSPVTTDEVSIPLELKIIDAASKEKKLIERIIGFTDFDWKYIVAKYKGVCSQPVDFNHFDEAICAILLKGESSAQQIGKILGFDITTDPAEKNILLSVINNLKKDEMIDGDESLYWLTDTGKEYAKNGVKFSTFERDFELYIDSTSNLKSDTKEIFSNLKSEKQPYFPQNIIPEDIDDVKSLAEIQAPEIHFPTKNFILQSCDFIKSECFSAKLWVVLLENFRDNVVRTLVYDEKKDAIIDILSESLDLLDDKKTELLEKLIRESEEDDFEIGNTTEPKQESQSISEKELIQKQKEIDVAVENNDIQKITTIKNEVAQQKRHFNSLEFEIELKRLFDTTADELWIISPWIKKYATQRRIPFFENYLRKGGRIFIAYSMPENSIDNMADEEALEKLHELDKKYQNFYIHQLPSFHYKRVWLKSKDKNLYYTGSYNILSFFVKQGTQNFRQEEMTRLDWNSENDEEYKNLFLQFGEKYLSKAVEEINELCQPNSIMNKDILQKIEQLSNGKLQTFKDKGYETFEKKYAEFEEIKDNKLIRVKQNIYTRELAALSAEINKVQNQTIPSDRKNDFQKRLDIIREQYPIISKTESFINTEEQVQLLKVFANQNKNKSKYNKKRRK
ncbi:MAG: hypothetical protein II939_16065 [Bacteroidales bacterium]|nr:hypothetical protein [Bacteroidales bacterium]